MKGEHFIAFALGILVGWLVVPMVLGMVGQGKVAG
jgi:hypothetical protein